MKVGPVSKSVAIQQYWKCYASHKNILGFFLALAAGVTTKPIIPRNTYISTCHKALAFLFHPLQFPARADRHPSIIINVGGRPGLDTHHISSDFIIRTLRYRSETRSLSLCVRGGGRAPTANSRGSGTHRWTCTVAQSGPHKGKLGETTWKRRGTERNAHGNVSRSV